MAMDAQLDKMKKKGFSSTSTLCWSESLTGNRFIATAVLPLPNWTRRPTVLKMTLLMAKTSAIMERVMIDKELIMKHMLPGMLNLATEVAERVRSACSGVIQE